MVYPNKKHCLLSSLQRKFSAPVTAPTLVLDLDETLVSCRPTSDIDSTTATKIILNGQVRQFMPIYITPRPGLQEFLATMSELYNLVLFTSGVKEYAESVLDAVEIRHFFKLILSREHCIFDSEGRCEKKLDILGLPMNRVIFIDNSPFHTKYQPNNILLIKSFEGDILDRELTLLAEFLTVMAKKRDVRPVMYHLEFFRRTRCLPPSWTSEYPQQLESDSQLVDKDIEDPEDDSTKYLSTDSNFEDIDENFEDQTLSKKLQELNWSQNGLFVKTSRSTDLLKFTNSSLDSVRHVKFQEIATTNLTIQNLGENDQNRQLNTFTSVITEGVNDERLIPKFPDVNLKFNFQDKVKNLTKRVEYAK